MAGTLGTFRSYFGAICVPILDHGDGTIENVTHDWANAMAGLSGGLAITVMRLQIRNYRVDIAKQRLVEMAIQNNCQWIYMADDDVIPPGDALLKMLRLWKSDPKYKVISGVYFSKSEPPMPLIFKGNLEGSFWDWKTTDLIKADGAGAGCLFVDTEVFKKMPKPWFSCDYYFEDPRAELDQQIWNLSDELGKELSLREHGDKNKIKFLEDEIGKVGKKIEEAKAGKIDYNMLNNRHRDGSTTEDLYFFKKVKEKLNLDLWVDCSIQCWHQDKRTGRLFGLAPDAPQSKTRFEGRYKRGEQVVLDIGAGDAPYWIEEGKPIRIDLDPATNPDIVCDARKLPLADTFADKIYTSHLLEHFSFRETIAVLREWVRVLKIGGTLEIVVPNLKWASKRILEGTEVPGEAERAMYMYYSGQSGDLKTAHDDVHRAGFTAESLRGVLERVGGLADIQVFTSEGNFGNWQESIHPQGLGYNIIAIAKKVKHEMAISLKMPLDIQEKAMYEVGEKAIQDKPKKVVKEKKLKEKRGVDVATTLKKNARKISHHV